MTEEEIQKQMTVYQAEEVWDTARYSNVKVINAEKGYFAGQYITNAVKPYQIVDRENNLIKSLEPYEITYIRLWTDDENADSRYLECWTSGMKKIYLLDRETLEIYYTEEPVIKLHQSGEYYLAYADVERNHPGEEVRLPDGSCIYRSEAYLDLTTEEGYVIERQDSAASWMTEVLDLIENERLDFRNAQKDVDDYAAGSSRVIHMEDGTVLYISKAGENIIDYCHGIILVRGAGSEGDSAATRLIDGTGNSLLDGQLFDWVRVEEEYIYGMTYPDWRPVIYSREGKLIYKGEVDERPVAVKSGYASIYQPDGDKGRGSYQNIKLAELEVNDHE